MLATHHEAKASLTQIANFPEFGFYFIFPLSLMGSLSDNISEGKEKTAESHFSHEQAWEKLSDLKGQHYARTS